MRCKLSGHKNYQFNASNKTKRRSKSKDYERSDFRDNPEEN